MAPQEGQMESVGARSRVQTGQFIGVKTRVLENVKTRSYKTGESYQKEL